MSTPDSTTVTMDQADGITQQLAEAILDDKKKEDTTAIKKASDISSNTSDKEKYAGHTAGPPLITLVDADSDLFGGHTPEDSQGGGAEC